MEILALGLGLGVGIVAGLLPGLHPALALALILALPLPFGPLAKAAFVLSACGASLYLKRLGNVYAPAANSSNIASLEPALRMTAQGQGPKAFRISARATDVAVASAGLLLGVLALVACLNKLWLSQLENVIGAFGLPVIGLWFWFTFKRSKRKKLLLAGMGLAGAVGYLTLHHPTLLGNPHAMAPLMAGLFGIPIALSVLAENAHGLPAQDFDELSLDKLSLRTGLAGSGIGMLTGFLAGLGAGSLVSLLSEVLDTDESYLLASASAEATNDVVALGLMLLVGLGRSGEAVLLGRALQTQPPVLVVLLLFGAFGLGCWVSRMLAFKLERSYAYAVAYRQQRGFVVLGLGLGVFQVILSGHILVGLSLMLAATGVGLLLKAWKLPNQAAFGSLTIPLLAQVAHLVQPLNRLTFGR